MDHAASRRLPLRTIAGYFLRLGALGFGGPIALAGYMQRDLVEGRRWVSQDEYLQGLAVAQTLPGPLAAQLAMWLGYVRRGVAGAAVAAVAFVLPPFLIVTAVAAVYVQFAGTSAIQALFYGIGPTVIALILRGAWKLSRVTMRSDRRLWGIFLAVAIVTVVVRSEVAVLFVLAGAIGVLLHAPRWRPSRPRVGALLPVPLLPLLGPAADPATLLALGVFFFTAGAFTFGSGLAIVPFLQQGVVQEHHWLTEREFLDAIAMGMITPGPVVITAVFVGFLVAGAIGGVVAAIGIFLPPFLLVVICAPWLIRHRTDPVVVGFTRGATAAAAGAIVGAAAVLASQVITDVPTLALFACASAALLRWRLPEPVLVGASGVAGLVLWAMR